uniref:Uncharacterized protein n=1 Tax=Romanomermis culicivorax TaxID=13658 RepID=A0A915I082_ROMCU
MIVGEESQNSDLKRKLNVEESESESESEFDDQEEDDDMAAALDAQFKN